jgi:2-polyprenyl-6-methoxyphenol hydroxylase-like FAD-dependent oxidoreductase
MLRMTARSAVVVGGGIGGLATAIALSGQGWRVRVFERAPEFAEVGAGISLWANALRALDAIGPGIAGKVRGLGGAELFGGIQHRTGRWLTRADAAELTRRFGPVLLLHRAELLRTLLDAVPPEALVAGTEVTGVGFDGDAVIVTHTGGETRADLLVGADGLHSTVRRLVWPDAAPPRYAGYTAWRWIAPPLPGGPDGGGETWGVGTRFGHVPLPDHRVYCYATANTPEGATGPKGEVAELRARFRRWHDPIPALVEAAAGTEVLRHDLYELPSVRSFARGRVALLGDAAHAMTPNLGQGACQALEDAATLGAVLATGREVAGALGRYDALRRPRAQDIVKRSRRMGAMGQWSSSLAVAVRDRLLPLVPAKVALRALEPVLNWQPPDPP